MDKTDKKGPKKPDDQNPAQSDSNTSINEEASKTSIEEREASLQRGLNVLMKMGVELFSAVQEANEQQGSDGQQVSRPPESSQEPSPLVNTETYELLVKDVMAKDGLKDFGKRIAEKTKEVKEAIKEAAKDTVTVIKEASQETGHDIKIAANAAYQESFRDQHANKDAKENEAKDTGGQGVSDKEEKVGQDVSDKEVKDVNNPTAKPPQEDTTEDKPSNV